MGADDQQQHQQTEDDKEYNLDNAENLLEQLLTRLLLLGGNFVVGQHIDLQPQSRHVRYHVLGGIGVAHREGQGCRHRFVIEVAAGDVGADIHIVLGEIFVNQNGEVGIGGIGCVANLLGAFAAGVVNCGLVALLAQLFGGVGDGVKVVVAVVEQVDHIVLNRLGVAGAAHRHAD